jgi:hypothetical protein
MAAFEFDPKQVAYIDNNFTNGFKFRMALFSMLPMGFLCGMRVRELNEKTCKVTVDYKWINKNPFKSTFWAVLGMAAEMGSGALLMRYTYKQKPSISMLVAKQTGVYHKKAVGRTTFICESGLDIQAAIRKTAETGEAVEVICPVKGYNDAKELICEFEFIWSMKARSQK